MRIVKGVDSSLSGMFGSMDVVSPHRRFASLFILHMPSESGHSESWYHLDMAMLDSKLICYSSLRRKSIDSPLSHQEAVLGQQGTHLDYQATVIATAYSDTGTWYCKSSILPSNICHSHVLQ